MEGPLFTDPPTRIRRDVDEHLARARQRRAQLEAEGDTQASGGRGRRREHATETRSGRRVDELWSDEDIRREAQLELQRQLTHRDPKLRRDAAREIQKLAAETDDAPLEILYVVGSRDDFDADEMEALDAAADQAAKEALERAAQARRR